MLLSCLINGTEGLCAAAAAMYTRILKLAAKPQPCQLLKLGERLEEARREEVRDVVLVMESKLYIRCDVACRKKVCQRPLVVKLRF